MAGMQSMEELIELVLCNYLSEETALLLQNIGLNLGNNHPHEIAISLAAQLIQERDRLLSSVQ